jgi:senataxin
VCTFVEVSWKVLMEFGIVIDLWDEDSIQYRMHPLISSFPSKRFYDSKLLDGPLMEVKTKQPWHEDSLLPPYAFFNSIKGREERNQFKSIYNQEEIKICLEIYKRFLNKFPKINFDYRIGIVTPYKGQVMEMRRQFQQRFGTEILMKIDFNTVDGFQGQEKDVIILSCVRAKGVSNNINGGEDGIEEIGGIGFLKDVRRMNVALTRARSSLLVVGNKDALRVNADWRALIEDSEERGVVRDVSFCV